jgi:hypothetical protein
MQWSLRSLSGALALATVVTVLSFSHLKHRHDLDWTLLDFSQRNVRSRNRGGVRIATVADHNQAVDSSPHVAILIAGQCHRFAYREQEGPIFSPPGENSSPTFDVFIVLQCGAPQKTFTGHVETPPYMKKFVDEFALNDSTFIQDVIDWYHLKGAQNVKVQILDEGIMTSREAEITNYVTRYHGNNGGENRNMTEFLREGNRWSIEARKFYLRHAVYEMALRQQERNHQKYSYDAFVFWREDNYFFRPLEMEHLLSIVHSSTDEKSISSENFADPTKIMSGHPQIVTDAPCTYGAYSDKMYVANRVGADLLFRPYYAAFLESMKRYVLFAYYRNHTSSQKSRNHHPFKPEMYVHDLLLAATVTPVDLGRVDIRYNDGQRCVPDIYHRCLPEETQITVRQHGLAVCQDNGLHWR